MSIGGFMRCRGDAYKGDEVLDKYEIFYHPICHITNCVHAGILYEVLNTDFNKVNLILYDSCCDTY